MATLDADDLNAIRGLLPKMAAFSGALRVTSDGVATLYPADSDTDAERGESMIEAQTAAGAGDTIYVCGNATIATALGKNGVDWYFRPGVTITASGTAKVFDDADGAMVYNVYGGGRFVTSDANCIEVGHASSAIYVECQSVRAVGASRTAVLAEAGRIVIKASERIESASYDAIWAQANSIIVFETPYINAGDSPIECTGAGAVVVGKAAYARGQTCSIGSGGRVAVEFGMLVGTDLASPLPTISIGDATGYIKSHYIVGIVTVEAAGQFSIIGAQIDSTDVAGLPTIYIAEDGLTLVDCELITKSDVTNSIGSADGSRVLGIIGNLKYNKALDASVTLSHSKTRADSRDGAALATAAGLLTLAQGDDLTNVEDTLADIASGATVVRADNRDGARVATEASSGSLETAVGAKASQASVDTIDDFLDTEVSAIKTKTDQLTFTEANKVDASADASDLPDIEIIKKILQTRRT